MYLILSEVLEYRLCMKIRFKINDLRLMIFAFFLALFIIHPSLIINHVYAQISDFTNVYDISDQDAKSGDIIIFDTTRGLVRSNSAYGINMFGLLTDQTSIELKRADGTGKPVIRSGIGKINIILSNGQIKKGDYITSSTLPGLGMKATLSGNVIGIALEDSTQNQNFNQNCIVNPSSCPTDQISIAVKPDYADLTDPRTTNRLFEYIGTAFFRNSQDPQGFGRIIKNVVAGIIVLVTLIFGLLIIARSVPKTVEAIGRNPLAKRSIQLTLALNIGIVAFVVIGGIVAAFIVLRL
jgi:hypothetical protein